MTYLAISGSRSCGDWDLFRKNVSEAVREWNLPRDTVVVSGGALGADKMAETWAKKRGYAMKIIYPDWKRHGKGAGAIRNGEIIDLATHLVAFPSVNGSGTQDTIAKAHKKGIPVKVVYIDK